MQRHFWPDVPTYAHLTKGIAAHLAADGHDVSVFTATPSYNAAYVGEEPPLRERVDGVRVRRVRMLSRDGKRLHQQLWDASLFLSRVAAHLLRHRGRYDIIVVTNAPPIFLASVVRLTRRSTGAQYVYHCQDLQPEAGVLSGAIPSGRVARTLRSIDRRNCAEAAAVVVLSTDMRETLTDRGIDAGNVHTINNFIIETAPSGGHNLATAPGLRKAFRVVFAGNMGRFQGLDRIVKAARLLVDHPEIQFTFMGSGSEVETLKAQSGSMVGKNVSFLPHQPLPAAMAILSESHLGLVPLRPHMYRVAYPSKIMAYAEAGCRTLLLMECVGDAAKTATHFDIGTCCDSSDPQLIADAIFDEYERYRQRGEQRDRVRAVATDLFGQGAIMPAWTEMIRSLDQGSGNESDGSTVSATPSRHEPVRPASAQDLDQIVAVHMVAFPGFTTTRLGPRFLRAYYDLVLNYPGHVFLVAQDQERNVVGFVAGFLDSSRFYGEFRRNRWRLGLAAAPSLFRDPRLVFDVRGGSDWASSQSQSSAQLWCELASIGVAPNVARSGTGTQLARQFAAEAFVAGADGVTLTTDADNNEAVHGFYRRLGYQSSAEHNRGHGRRMVEYRLYCDGHHA